MSTEVDWTTVSRGGYDEFVRMRQRQFDLMRFDSEFASSARSSEPGISTDPEPGGTNFGLIPTDGIGPPWRRRDGDPRVVPRSRLA